MTNTSIKLKKSSVSGKIPLVSDIDYGELAINYADGKLYYKHNDTSIRSFLDSGQILYLIDSDYLKGIINSTYIIANRPINLLEDSNPALGGNLNLNGHNITDSGSSGSITMSGNITGGTITATADFRSTAAWDATAGGGQLYLNGATGNRIDFNTNGVAGPSYTTRSTGTKLLLYPALSGVQVDYAMGISPATIWSSVPVNDSSYSFKWYGGDINVASLTGNGNFTAAGTITATQFVSTNNNTGQNFRIGDDAWIGDINVANTTRISGAQDATQGYIVFGNGNSVALGRSGTGPLTYGGGFSAVELTSTNAAGDEGGQINLARPATNTTLGGTITVDVYQNKLRFFEGSVNAKGAYIDLSACANGVGTNLLTGGTGSPFDSNNALQVLDSAASNGTGLSYSNGTLSIANTGVAAGTYGSASLVPVLTVNAQGQVDSIGTVSVAGVSSTDWDSATGNFIISTADGGSYYTKITLDPYTTTNLGEGTNKYYTKLRADSDARNALTGSTGITYTRSTGIITTNDAQIIHDNLSGFVANEHVDHSLVSILAGNGLKGGGDITASRTISIDSAQIKGLFSSGTGVSYNSGTGSISIGQAVGTGDTPTFNGLSASSAKITSLATPTVGTDAANKSYVDTLVSAALHYHDPVRVESPINLNATYNNGASGVGATLTNAGTQAALIIDGVNVDSDDRVLVYEQTTQTQNGVYVVTHKGSPTSNWVLTRSDDTDSAGPSSPNALGKGDAFYVKEGVTGAGELYVMNTEGTIIFGTTNITFSQISSAQIYKAGYGIELSGTTFSVDSDRVVLSVNSLKGNITATNLLDAIKTVDGATSGLDADLLDGQHGSYYRINVYDASGTLLN
jgi:hypothetical protein